MSQRVQCLVGVGGTDGNVDGLRKTGKVLHQREAQSVCSFVAEQEKLVVWHFAYYLWQCSADVGGNYHFVHNIFE